MVTTLYLEQVRGHSSRRPGRQLRLDPWMQGLRNGRVIFERRSRIMRRELIGTIV